MRVLQRLEPWAGIVRNADLCKIVADHFDRVDRATQIVAELITTPSQKVYGLSDRLLVGACPRDRMQFAGKVKRASLNSDIVSKVSEGFRGGHYILDKAHPKARVNP